MNKLYKPSSNDDELKLLRKEQVLKSIPIGATTLYDEIAKGRFPQPIKIGSRASAWIKSEIDAWLAQRVAQRRNKHQ